MFPVGNQKKERLGIAPAEVMEMPGRIRSLVWIAIVAPALRYVPGWAQSRIDSGLQIEVREVKVLSHLGFHYKTMQSLPNAEYQHWQIAVGGAVWQQAAEPPGKRRSKWIELLVLARNTGDAGERLQFASPQLRLPWGESVQPWESIFAGMGNYQSIAKALQLSEAPPLNTVLHVGISGNISCNLQSMQQTWTILIFQAPETAQEGTLSLGSYAASPIAIPAAEYIPVVFPKEVWDDPWWKAKGGAQSMIFKCLQLHDRKWNAMTVFGIVAVSFLAGSMLTSPGLRTTAVKADSNRVFELRVYHAVPGKVPALEARFRDTIMPLFAKHDLTPVGFWVPEDAPASDNTFIYILAHPSREDAKKNWAALFADPGFQVVLKSEQAEKQVQSIDSTYMRPTDFSPMK